MKRSGNPIEFDMIFHEKNDVKEIGDKKKEENDVLYIESLLK